MEEGWTVFRKIAFRFVCLFMYLSIAEIYAPMIVVPFIGERLSSALDYPFSKAAVWIAVHVFHVTGIAAAGHATDSRDTVLGWTTMLVIVLLSLPGTVLWSLLDRRRPNYARAALWMRYLLRLSLVFIMLRYGIFKIFPLQMSRPSLGVLNEPLGQTSPMTLLWTL